MNKALQSVVVFAVTILIMAFGLELFLVQQNNDGKNYDIEMWKYARKLKQISENPKLGHEHIPNKSAVLQNTKIKINSLGMRDEEPVKNPDHRILFLGSSITLGWGVKYPDIYPELLETMLETSSQSEIEVLNAGIGNYNTEREVELFFTKLKDLNPDTIVISYFVNDSEIIPPPRKNWLLQNSQLAVTLWSRMEQISRAAGVKEDFIEHYQNIYKDDYEGWQIAQDSLRRLAKHAKKNNIKVVLTMIPDIHNLDNYPFEFIHEKIAKLSQELGFQYIDFLDDFRGINPETLWAMPGDPHPNVLGHKIMAERLYQELNAV